MFFADVINEGPQGRTAVSYFDVHDFDIYSIFVCVLNE